MVQPGSIHALGAWGRRFESYLPDQLINQPMTPHIYTKLKVIYHMSKWLLSPHYIHLRLSTMYGSRYYIYILRHPIRFVQDINSYLNWCITMDKLK